MVILKKAKSYSIPLKGNIFTVGGKLQDKKDGAITVSQTKPVENKMADN